MSGFPSLDLDEIFLSIQGEAGQVGRPHLFLRLGGCPLRCNYCDTPKSWRRRPKYKLHRADGVQRLSNPVTFLTLEGNLHALAGDYGLNADQLVLSITGGEPLVQADKLQLWLPTWKGKVLLETSGIYPDRLKALLAELDWVSLDWKDPADLNAGAPLLAAAECLQELVAEADRRQRALPKISPFQYWVKFVVQKNTRSDWLQQQLQQIAEIAPGCEVYLQPVTPGETDVQAPSAESLLAELIQGHSLPLDLRVLPQIHPMLGVL